MREVMLAALIALAVSSAFFVVAVMTTQPHIVHTAKNAYWPYSVETVVKDR